MDIEQTPIKKESNFIDYDTLISQSPDQVLIAIVEKINNQQKEINGLWKKIRSLKKR